MTDHTHMPDVTRRWIAARAPAALATALLAGAAPGLAFGAQPPDTEVLAGLERFLDRAFVPGSLQCSARVGDGVPDYADVKAFIDGLRAAPRHSSGDLVALLDARSRADAEAGRIAVIDGWVFSRTEALAASAHALMREAAC